MKRPIAACILAGILFAVSTPAFATPVTIWDQTLDINTRFGTSTTASSTSLTWEHPFTYDPVLFDIEQATLTIVANNVRTEYHNDPVSIGLANTGPWTPTGTSLTGGAPGADTVTVINVTPWLVDGGFWTQVEMLLTPAGEGWGWWVEVKTSQLVVTGNELPPPPPPPPWIPAPGALLLAGIGAGLVSWLRARKAL